MALVTMEHLRALGYCAPRIRSWCREHDVDIRELLHGVDSGRLRDTRCPFAAAAADLAEQESQWAERKAKQSDTSIS